MNTIQRLSVFASIILFCLPGISLAQTQGIAGLQAEIQSLLAQVQVLETQLRTQEGSADVWCYTFNNNLSIGMSGSQVTALQSALEKNGESVAMTGTFDDQTVAAVTGFQDKYASSILAPNGLTNGTGYAGSATRAELNSLFGCNPTSTAPTPTTPPVRGTNTVPPASTTVSAPPIETCPASGCNGPAPIAYNPVVVTAPVSPPVITLVDSQPDGSGYVVVGQSAGIVGTGFLTSNTVYLSMVGNTSVSANVPAQLVNANTLSFVAPASLATGQYTLRVTNANGVSNSMTVTLETSGVAPTVTLVDSQPDGSGYVVVGQSAGIVGTGFLTSNTVYLSMVGNTSVSANVPAQLVNANTLSFVAPASLATGQYTLRVTNANGVSNSMTVTLETSGVAPTVTLVDSQPDGSGYVVVGQSAGIVGTGFLTSNTVYLSMVGNTSVSANVPAQLVNANTLSFVAPASLATGQYTLRVTNANGVSNSMTVTLETSGVAPTVTLVDSQPDGSGYVVVGQSAGIVGTGFLTSNTVYLSMVGNTSVSANVPAQLVNANTLSFVAPASLATGQYTLRVTNANGVSNSMTVTLEQ